jgi:hypothetical protein
MGKICPSEELRLKLSGVYSTPCKCGKMNTGQTSHSTQMSLDEHHNHIQLYQPQKSAKAIYSSALIFIILMNTTSTTASKYSFRDQLISNVIEIKLHPNNINRDSLNSSSKPLIHSLKETKKFPPRTNRLPTHK